MEGVLGPRTFRLECLGPHAQNIWVFENCGGVEDLATEEVPVDTLFDMKPGDIFVMRNAGDPRISTIK